jgi:hypothetical protein
MPKPPVELARLTTLVPSFRTLARVAPLVAFATSACLDRPVSPARPTTTNLYVHTLPNNVVDKADLLFMIDNSASMADKQEILANAVPVLVERLATPRCLDSAGKPTGEVSDTTGHCASGRPEFTPLKDIHVGVITSSLGSHGGTGCEPRNDDATTHSTPDDRAELLPTANPGVRGTMDSWNQAGFLAWDPTQTKNTPPGDADLRHFSTAFGDQVRRAGEHGCGFEGSLEAWYRFLVDPAPPTSVGKVVDAEGAVHVALGPVNQTLLAQRKAFLRPDSLLAIVMLTDENDCSVDDDDGAQGWLVATTADDDGNALHLPRAAAVCATAPNDRCCHSCGLPAPDGCTPNDSDAECNKHTALEPEADDQNLRCFEQKRRFGLDLLYPLERYIDGLTKPLVRDHTNQEVPNPIFAARPGEPRRSKDLVLLAGIVGVPWQDIATDDSLTGDGLTYLTAAELSRSGRWSMILGGSDGGPPDDPLMRESIAPRAGTNPILNAPLVPPGASGSVNPINGHEQNVLHGDDLQYACIFPLPEARQCTDENAESCDCAAGFADYERPLCEYPTDPEAHGVQRFAKAYPGLRELGVLQGVGDNGIVASICAKHTQPAPGLSEAADASYGYNPAVTAMGNVIVGRLAQQCLPRPLSVETDPSSPSRGEVPCAVVEALPGRRSTCACDETHGRSALGAADAKLSAAVSDELWSEGDCGGQSGQDCHDYCLCKLAPLTGPGLDACQNGNEDATSFGYCYVDPAQGIGNPALVAGCPASNQRSLRFVGDGLPANGSTLFVACIGSTFDEDTEPAVTRTSAAAR